MHNEEPEVQYMTVAAADWPQAAQRVYYQYHTGPTPEVYAADYRAR